MSIRIRLLIIRVIDIVLPQERRFINSRSSIGLESLDCIVT